MRAHHRDLHRAGARLDHVGQATHDVGLFEGLEELGVPELVRGQVAALGVGPDLEGPELGGIEDRATVTHTTPPRACILIRGGPGPLLGRLRREQARGLLGGQTSRLGFLFPLFLGGQLVPTLGVSDHGLDLAVDAVDLAVEGVVEFPLFGGQRAFFVVGGVEDLAGLGDGDQAVFLELLECHQCPLAVFCATGKGR